jgi:hypothetical protein
MNGISGLIEEVQEISWSLLICENTKVVTYEKHALARHKIHLGLDLGLASSRTVSNVSFS